MNITKLHGRRLLIPAIAATAHRRTVAILIVLVRVVRVLLVLALAVIAISLLMGFGTPTTGRLERVAFLLLFGGCVYSAAKVTAITEWLVHRLGDL